MRLHFFSARPRCLWPIAFLILTRLGYSEDRIYYGTGTVVYTVQCGTTTHSVTGTAEIVLMVTNNVFTDGFDGEILNPYMLRFPREPAVEPIVAAFEATEYDRRHAFHCSPDAEITMSDASTLICPPVGGQNHVVGGGFSEDGNPGAFDWLIVSVVTHCTGNTCTGTQCSVKTTARWEFLNIPNYNASTCSVFAGRVQDVGGQAVTNANFFVSWLPAFNYCAAPMNEDVFWEDRQELLINSNGNFSTRLKGSGPIRVMSYYSSLYNGYSKVFTVPKSNAVITLIPKALTDFDCVLEVGGTVQAREKTGDSWGAWFDVHPGSQLTSPWEMKTAADSYGLVHMDDAYRKGNIDLGSLGSLSSGVEPSPTYKFIVGVAESTWTVLKFLCSRATDPATNLPIQFRYQNFAVVGGVHGTGFKLASTGGVHMVEVADGLVSVTRTNGPPTWYVPPGRRLKMNETSAWMEDLTSNEWAELVAEAEALGWDMEPCLRTDFSEPALPPWMRKNYGCWGNTPSNILRWTGYHVDDFPFALIGYACSNASIQADARKISGNRTNFLSGFGLHLRSDAVEYNFYEFGISTAGKYYIGRYSNGWWKVLVAETNSSALRAGLGTWNTLKAAAQGTNLSFYANGQLLAMLSDNSLAHGYFGLFTIDDHASTNTDIVEFDNVVLRVDTPDRGEHAPSVFEQKSLSGGACKLSWSGQPAEWYTVKSGSNLLDGFNTIVTQNIRGQFPITTWTSPPSAGPGSQFFRVDQQ